MSAHATGASIPKSQKKERRRSFEKKAGIFCAICESSCNEVCNQPIRTHGKRSHLKRKHAEQT